MAMGLFDIFTADEVAEIRAKTLELVTAGQSNLSWTSEGTSVTKTFTLPITTVLEELKYWYQTHDSGSYGSRVTRTRPFYTTPI